MHEGGTENARDGNPRADSREDGPAQHRPTRRAELPECPRGGENQDPRASDPGKRPQHEPRREALRQPHAQRHEANDHEPGTDSGRGPDAQAHRRQGAEQVTEIVGRCQPSSLANRYRGILLHHGEDRREGEPPDAHCDPQGSESRQGDDHRGGHVVDHAPSLGRLLYCDK